MTVVESALIVPVLEAEPVIGRPRAALDPAASLGVPAHVTVLYPLLPPEEITEEVRRDVCDLVAAVPAFDVDFSRVRGSMTRSSGWPPSLPGIFVVSRWRSGSGSSGRSVSRRVR